MCKAAEGILLASFLLLMILNPASGQVTSSNAEPAFPYELNRCLCQFDETLRNISAVLQGNGLELAAGTRKKRSATAVGILNDYYLPPTIYHGVFFNSSKIPKLCQCFVDTVVATRLHLKNTEWDDALGDPKSEEYGALAEEIQQQFDQVFKTGAFSGSYIRSFVTKFRKEEDNSTTAVVDIQSSSDVDTELLRQHFFRSTRRGTTLGSLKINPPYFSEVEGSSATAGDSVLNDLLAQAEAISKAHIKPLDESWTYFYTVTLPAFFGMGFILLGCLCGLSERGCLCKNVTKT